jgi:hypothetical protein
MRLRVRYSASFVALSLLAVAAGAGLQAQTSTAAQASGPQTAGNGTYLVIDPLAGVRYNNRFDISLGMAYDHMKAGPTLLQGANLGGLDLSGSYWLAKRWGVEGTGRAYVGTSGAQQRRAGWQQYQGTVCGAVLLCRRSGMAGTA